MAEVEITRVEASIKEWLKKSHEGTRKQEELLPEKLEAVYRAKPLNGKHVLLVEDHVALRNAIDQILRCAGADVAIVANGTQAFKLVEDAMQRNGSIFYDLLLMDSEMTQAFLAAFLDQIW